MPGDKESQGDEGAEQLYHSDAYESPRPSVAGRHWMVDLAVTFKTWIGAITVIGIVVLGGDFVQIPGWVDLRPDGADRGWSGARVRDSCC